MARLVTNGLDLNNQKITNLADPSAATDAVNLQTVQAYMNALVRKAAVAAASTAPITLSAPGATIDGVTMNAGDRFLAKNQATLSENGIWVWNGAASAATRPTDFATGSEQAAGTTVFVTGGTANGDTQWSVTEPDQGTFTVDTDDNEWVQSGGGAGATYTFGDGLTETGGNVTVDPDTGILVGPGGVSIDTSIVTRKYASNVGAGANPVITHNLGTLDVQVELFVISTGKSVEPDWTHTSTNSITLHFPSDPGAGVYRVVVFG